MKSSKRPAGRDGAASECIMLYSGQDVMVNQYLLDNKAPNEELGPEENALVRERDSQRLQSMVGYARSTNCLRKYILEYFGEYGLQRCENCSVCRGEYEEQDCTEQARQVVTCILELRQRYGVNVVAGTLHGDKRSKLLALGADRCSTYGVLQALSEDRIKRIIRELEEREYLESTPDKYAVLKVCARAQDLLEGSDSLILRFAREEESAAARTRKARKSDVLNSRGLELFDVLKKLRMELAREGGVPPYMVFSDKTLTDMCIRLPFDKGEMLQVAGVGERKYENYGPAFLEAVREFTRGRKEKTFFGEQGPDSFSQIAADGGTDAQTLTVREGKRKPPKTPFMVTPMQAALFRPTDMCLATELAEELNRLADLQTVKKLSGAEILRYAVARGWIQEEYQGGQWKKLVTEEGDKAGYFLGRKTSRHGTEYEVVYLTALAQQAVLEHYTD